MFRDYGCNIVLHIWFKVHIHNVSTCNKQRLYDIGNAEGLLVLDADVRFPFYGFGLGETKLYYLK